MSHFLAPRRLLTSSGLIAAIAFASVANAQTQPSIGNGNEVTPIKMERLNVSPSVINTNSFRPQVAPTFTNRGVRPSNPKTGIQRTPLDANAVPLPAEFLEGAMKGQNVAAPSAKFPGITFTGSVPPDPHIAVGPTHVVQVVNSHIAFFRKDNGTRTFFQPLSAGGFWSGVAGVGNFIFDPRVVFDPETQRFFVISLDVDFDNETSAVEIGISDDADPSGNWTRYKFSNDFADAWGDYPSLAVNDDLVAITYNHFGWQGGAQGTIQVFNKDSLINGNPTSGLIGTGQFTLQMAKNFSVGGPLVGFGLRSTNGARLIAVTGPANAPVLVQRDVAIPAFSPQNAGATMLNAAIDTIGDRMMDTSFIDGSLVYAFTANEGPAAGRSHVRWGEVNLGTWPASGLPSLTQAGRFVAEGEDDSILMPAIAKNSEGSISVVATRTGPTLAPEFVIASRNDLDPAGELGPVTVLGTSGNFSSVNFGGTSRWGDYAGIGIDPLDNTTFWGCHEIFQNGNGSWGTEIATWTVLPSSIVSTGGPTGVVPIFGTNIAGTLAGLLNANDSQSYTVRSSMVSGRGQYAGYDLTFNFGNVTTDVRSVEATIIGTTSSPRVTGFLYMYNNTTARWDLVANARVTRDGTTTFEASVSGATANNYVAKPSGDVRVRVVALNSSRRVREVPPAFDLVTDFAEVTTRVAPEEDN